ncbi:MAG: ATP phosphoribosyltransferase regulatory subunit [Solirubrobacterales bacterium]
MNNWMRYIPEGTKDILFEECKEKIRIENLLRDSYIRCGFKDIISPSLEFYDVFNGEHTTIAQETMYKLFDNQGRIMVLRPDVTTPIARITATKLNEAVLPLRFCYTANVFRVNESLFGKTNEVTQSGIEIIGINSTKADAETIITGINALISSGLKDFQVEIGHAEFFKSLLEEINLTFEQKDKIRKYVEDKNFIALDHFVMSEINENYPGSLKAIKELPKLFGGIDVIERAAKLTKNKKALEALKNIMDIYLLIDKAGLSAHVTFDLGMVKHMDYYSGIIFRAFSHGSGGYILSGGRYDDLINKFGRDLPAIGFAIDIDSLISALQNLGQIKPDMSKHLVLYYTEELYQNASSLAETFRKSGFICEMSLFDDEESTLEYALNKDIPLVVSVVEKEIIRLYKYNKKWNYKDFQEKFFNNFIEEAEKTYE